MLLYILLSPCCFSLAEVSNQMLELYEQNRIPQSQGSEAEGAAAGGARAAARAPATSEEQASKQISSHSPPQRSSVENNAVPLSRTENQSNDGSAEMGSDITDHKMDSETRDSQTSEKLPDKDKLVGDQEKLVATKEAAELGRSDDTSLNKSSFNVGQNLELREGPLGQSPIEAIKIDKDKVKAILEKRRKERGEMTVKKDVMDEDDLIERELEDGVEMTNKTIDKDKVKTALEKMRKERGEMTIKKDIMDEDDLIERELEDGVELAVENEKNKQQRRQSLSKPDDEDHGKDLEEARDGSQMGMEGKLRKDGDGFNAEKGDMIDDASSLLNNRKRKKGSPPASQPETKKRLDSNYHNDFSE